MGYQRWVWLPAAVASAVIATACTEPNARTSEPTSPATSKSSTSAGPDKELVGWIDVVCAAEKLSLWNPSPPVTSGDLTEADRQAVITYLTEGRDTFTQATALLDDLGPSPVPDGDDLVTELRDAVVILAARFDIFILQATTFPAPDFGAPYRQAQDAVASFTVRATLGELAEDDPSVAAAQEQAPRCQ